LRIVPARVSRARLLALSLTSLLFAGFRPATGAGLAPPPAQTMDVVASGSGFTPSVIHVRKGETLHLRLTSRDREHCFALEAFRIEKRVVPNRTITVDLTPERAGTFPYYCCLETGAAGDAERGSLIVGE
jgi:heme/copper-type cytochrome/quinol oxidase subunit 2